MEEPLRSTLNRSFNRSPLRTSHSMQLSEAFRRSDMIDPSFSCGISPPVDEFSGSPLSSHPLSPPPGYQIAGSGPFEAERQSCTESDIYTFYEGLSERAFDLSMTDLVIHTPFCKTDGLPIEDNCAHKTLKNDSFQQVSAPERKCARTARNKLASWLLFPKKSSATPPDRTSSQEPSVFLHEPQLRVSKSSPTNDSSRSKASALGFSIGFSRSISSKSHRKQSARISPKITPMSSPRSSSASAMFATSVNIGSLDIMSPRNTVSANARQKNPGVKMDSNNQCSVCSSYTSFFKSRCQVCGRLYCSNCMQEAVINMPDGTRCRGFCAQHPSKRYGKKSAQSACWPFGSRRGDEDEV
ncbi:hypothetical protein O6H91_14G040700 [Diphasiastrum complanatum]|uniref:Uncharacterized protein n=1 Tax=Diphasiastrum complanatum TaxID=34168 RepID=A0ACC2BNG8_DIPCM|nr:hypothetical protein O6H91_Y316900 [Diphasiastrum complanatum]KAJ7531327.1 hypothetical protein O6H91_14G040700 [Diphasiastrum complanatum]